MLQHLRGVDGFSLRFLRRRYRHTSVHGRAHQQPNGISHRYAHYLSSDSHTNIYYSSDSHTNVYYLRTK